MDTYRAFASLAISLGLGLLVGLQRERADSAIAGFRTFPLVTLLGTIAAMLSDVIGGWVVAAGLIAIAGATAVGNLLRPRTGTSPGITTEVAALLMFLVGALLWLGSWSVGAAAGVVCAILLHLKGDLHALAGRINDRDMRAMLQFAAITFVVLPVLPDQTYGPLNVLNPRQIWWMVVLVVGICLIGYVAAKLVAGRTGVLLSGLIGGLISSTATTASAARRARDDPAGLPVSLLLILLATCVMHARILTEIAVVGGAMFASISPPVFVLLLLNIVVTAVIFLRPRTGDCQLPSTGNPAHLRFALWFALIYALILLLSAAAKHFFGDRAVFVVAAISGLTDMDAITISSSRLAAGGSLAPDSAWRAIVIAIISNTVFKTILAGSLGGRRLLLPVGAALGCTVAAGAALLWLWPADL